MDQAPRGAPDARPGDFGRSPERGALDLRLGDFGRPPGRGVLDVRLGDFGPQQGRGALRSRFQYVTPDALFVSCRQQAEVGEIGEVSVVGRAETYLWSEPALLRGSIAELRALAAEDGLEAYLEAL